MKYAKLMMAAMMLIGAVALMSSHCFAEPSHYAPAAYGDSVVF